MTHALKAADHWIRTAHLYRWLPAPSLLVGLVASWWWTTANSLSTWGCDLLVSGRADEGSAECISVAAYWAEDARVGFLSAAVTYLALVALLSGVEWFMDGRRERGAVR